MAPAKRAGRDARRPYHHGDLRRALLDETIATIRAEGVEGVTLREIGARLGVSRTALYRHFADKRALLGAVATEGFRTLRRQLEAAFSSRIASLTASPTIKSSARAGSSVEWITLLTWWSRCSRS